MDWCLVTFFLVLHVLWDTVAGNGACTTTKGVLHYGKKSYNGTILKQVNQIGIKSCINVCERIRTCTHINYNRCDLKCDLMADDVEEEPEEYVTSSDMTCVALNEEVRVRDSRSCKITVTRVTFSD